MDTHTPCGEEKLRAVAVKRIRQRRAFWGMVVTYVIIAGVMVVIWALGDRGSFWPAWVFLGLGVATAFSAWNVFGRRDATEADVEAEMQHLKGDDTGRGG